MHSGLRAAAVAGLVALAAGCQPVHPVMRRSHEAPPRDMSSLYNTPGIGLLWKERQQNSQTPGDARDAQPSVWGDEADRWLAYTSTNQSNNPKLFLKSPSGSAVRQITYGLSSEMFPKFSPDGKWIAFASDRNGSWDIYILNRDRPEMWRQVSFDLGEEIAPSWSPDGKKLVYCAKGGNEGWSLWIADLETGGFTNLGPGLFPDWSPNPEPELQLIAFQKPRYRSMHLYGIWTITPDGTKVTSVVEHDEWAAINPSWSMDGHWIAFATVNKSPESWDPRYGKADDVWAVRRDGTDRIRVTEDPAPEWDPCWGRDRLYFISGRDGRQNVWSVKPTFLDIETDTTSGN